MARGASPSTFGREIGAGGLNIVPAGWIETINRGCCPKPGLMGTFSGFTVVTVMQPVREPPGNVAVPGATVNANPGDCGKVSVPPCVSSTHNLFTVSRAGR